MMAIFNWLAGLPIVLKILFSLIGLAASVGTVYGLARLLKRTGANYRKGHCSRKSQIATNVISCILCVAIAGSCLSVPIGAIVSMVQSNSTPVGSVTGAESGAEGDSDAKPDKKENLDRRSVTAEELNADNLSAWIKLHIGEDVDLDNLKLDTGSFGLPNGSYICEPQDYR